ncbi:DUF7916 family protein [Hutsoniella sourekii]|uniref:DUF7916 family protein n=1 Tax=Hutsoniella sourekii TaxID=87650 RepID=UPI000487FA3B|nr:hypothetical protein [Hutsoniella sourekii]
MKRLISCYASDLKNRSRAELKQSIQASEGRTVLAETVVTASPLLEGVTNAEVMAAFGADMICLNELDVFDPQIVGFDCKDNPIAEIKRLTGRLVGINLEPVDEAGEVMDVKVNLVPGRRASKGAFQAAQDLGVDFIMITGNPSTGVTNQGILQAISTGREFFQGLLFAGKMHGAGVAESVINQGDLENFIESGADGVLIPTVGTVPGVTLEETHQACSRVHQLGGLVMSTIGTSQESADEDTIRRFALANKQTGSDIHHIGDGGYGRMPLPENITALSIVVRGKRHTYFKMAQSILR